MAVTYEPWMTKAAKQGKGKIIFTSKGTNIIPDGLASRDKLIQERRADILAYIRAVERGVKLAKEKPEEIKNIVAKRLGISPQEVPQQLSGALLFDIETNKSVVFNTNNRLNVVDSIKFAAKTAKELKFTSKLVDAKTVYEDSLIKSF
jgi:NitT/TauT family transport system substrate-binding protein